MKTVASRAALLLAGTAALACWTCARAPARDLRVCADPNNLPFSNERQEGFENRIAALVAREMRARVTYTWWPQRRGFVRNTLGAGLCDVIVGVPRGYEPVRTTKPYYRSSYAFVSRRDRGLSIRSFDDPRLRALRIGVHTIGDDYAGAPPAHALARRNLASKVVPYSLYGDYREPSPPARLIEAVAAGTVDVAIAWGPLAGYFAPRQAVPLDVAPAEPPQDAEAAPLAYDISMGVRRDDRALQEELDAILHRRAPEIQAILAEYGVPTIPLR